MGQWSQPDTLPQEVNIADKQAYPYVLSDGVTIYFAACDSNGLGGYDIYVTRYNTYTDSYTTPENLGMPFNSTANDYLMLIDEHNNIGYFATDRFSPKGKVRIYSFIPAGQKSYWRGLSQDSLVAYAQLRYTWSTERMPSNNNTTSPSNRIVTEDTEKKIFFVLNDSVVYTSVNDFQNPNALKKYQEWEELQKQITNNTKRLEQLRHQYSEADPMGQKKLTPTILRLEQLQSQYSIQSNDLINQSRELEVSNP